MTALAKPYTDISYDKLQGMRHNHFSTALFRT